MIESLLVLVFALAATFAQVLWYGYAANILWGWFVTPAFGLASPGVVAIAGISLVVSVVVGPRYREQPERTSDQALKHYVNFAVFHLIAPPLALFLGYVLKGWA